MFISCEAQIFPIISFVGLVFIGRVKCPISGAWKECLDQIPHSPTMQQFSFCIPYPLYLILSICNCSDHCIFPLIKVCPLLLFSFLPLPSVHFVTLSSLPLLFHFSLLSIFLLAQSSPKKNVWRYHWSVKITFQHFILSGWTSNVSFWTFYTDKHAITVTE